MNRLPRVPVWLIVAPLLLLAAWSLILPSAVNSVGVALAAVHATARPTPRPALLSPGAAPVCPPGTTPVNARAGFRRFRHVVPGFGFWSGAWSRSRDVASRFCRPSPADGPRGPS